MLASTSKEESSHPGGFLFLQLRRDHGVRDDDRLIYSLKAGTEITVML